MPTGAGIVMTDNMGPRSSLITRLAYYLFFLPRSISFGRHAIDADNVQRRILRSMVSRARNTVWGRKYGYVDMLKAEDLYGSFSSTVPVCEFNDLSGYFDRMYHGEKDVLWPGSCRQFAVTSSTTSSISKHIPVFRGNLKDTHLMGGIDSAAAYLRHNRSSRVFSGRTLMLTSVYHPELDVDDTRAGAISAILYSSTPRISRLFKSPSVETACISNFSEKIDRTARETAGKHITALAGQPPWLLELLKKVLEVTGKENITQVWPDLEVFFHGGMAFDSYRQAFQRMIPSERMNYVETYNASEGFFGVQTSPDDSAMSLCIDYGVFYEFIPYPEFVRGGREAVPIWEVTSGEDYVLLISTTGGLWRFLIGDVIRFTSLRPYKFKIVGRTAQNLNVKGEDLNVDCVTAALTAAGSRTGAIIREFSLGPETLPDDRMRPNLLVEFEVRPESTEAFTDAFDDSLKDLSREYEMTRTLGLVERPRVIVAADGAFLSHMESTGHLDPQHKVPRITGSMELIDQIARSSQ